MKHKTAKSGKKLLSTKRRYNRRTKLRTPKTRRRPSLVYRAVRNLQDAARHVTARASELDGALEALREQERLRAVKELLQSLRNSPAGNLIKDRTDSSNETNQLILQALIEAFDLKALRSVGEQLTISESQIGRIVELDREYSLDVGQSAKFEVTAVGWECHGAMLIPPTVRPLPVATSPVVRS